MKRLSSVLLGAALVAALLGAAPAIRAQAAEEAAGATPNIMVTFRMGKIEDGKRVQVKAYDLVVAGGMRGSRLLSGERVPIPTSEGESDRQAYVYQNIGFTTSVEAQIIGEDKILLLAEIEDSRIRGGEEGEPPVVETRQLSVNVILTDGVPLALTRVEGLSDQPGYVEVEASILK